MIKECSNCHSKISFIEYYKHYFKNRFIYTCSKCGTVHRSTTFSRIVTAIILIITILYSTTKSSSFSLNIFWILIYFLILEPLLLQYERKD